MNPVVYPNELNSFGWQMYNAGKMNPVQNFNKLQENSVSASEYKPHNKIPSISKVSTKTKINSISEKPNKKSKNMCEENYINKIFTLDEIMKYIISKSHRNSKNPFIIIPVKGQSNAFYLLKINDSKLMDGKTDDSITNRDDDQLSSKLNSITKPAVNQMPYNNPHENLSVKSNPIFNYQNEMFMLPPVHPTSSSNLSLDNVANYTQYNLMNFWLQQQSLFQQQIFQHQQQQLLLQQQQLQYQQQIQRRLQLQQQHLAKKNNLQSKHSGSYDIFNMIPPSNNEQSELTDAKIEPNNIHNESILSKFVVKKIEEPCMNAVQFSKTDSTSFSLEDDRLKHGSKVEHQKIKKTKDKTSKNKTMENHCNLDTFNDKNLNETFTNSQGEHDRNNFQQKMDREKSILFSRSHLESEINHQPNDRLKCNNDHSIINHSVDTNNTATSTSELFKTPSKNSKRNCGKKKLEVNSTKAQCKTKDFNHSSTVDFTDSEN